MEDVIIGNEKMLEEKIRKFQEVGADKIHILSDFDRTFTKAFVGGEKVPSVISILRNGNYLTSDYAEKAHALFDKYHPIEIDKNLSIEEKKKAMNEWWKKHFDLLIESGLNKKDIEDVIKSDKIVLRDGVAEFIENINKQNIPLVILSSAGLGGDSISMVLKRENILYGNVYVVSNNYVWDKKENAVGVKEPIVHVFNKDETALPDDIHKKVEDRKNVILLGDSLGDLGMIEGFNYDEIIKIGFFNFGDESDLEEYKEKFDVVITGDGNFDYVNELMNGILK